LDPRGLGTLPPGWEERDPRDLGTLPPGWEERDPRAPKTPSGKQHPNN